jgi:hypothetical protein
LYTAIWGYDINEVLDLGVGVFWLAEFAGMKRFEQRFLRELPAPYKTGRGRYLKLEHFLGMIWKLACIDDCQHMATMHMFLALESPCLSLEAHLDSLSACRKLEYSNTEQDQQHEDAATGGQKHYLVSPSLFRRNTKDRDEQTVGGIGCYPACYYIHQPARDG